jgi:multidrug efflux pump subunit AcrA (membrane-fusion protein)
VSVHDLAASHPTTDVPAPRSRWLTRTLIPAAIFTLALGMLVYASWDRLVPATSVRVVPVVVKAVQGQEAGRVTVQAPGWVEPDPHPHFASALTAGIVEAVLVLEGEEVRRDQIVARMVDDDAELALARAEATLAQRQAALEAARASLRAAERTIEHLIGPRQAEASAEESLAEIDAKMTKLSADLLVTRAQAAEIQDELTRKSSLVDSRAVSEADVRRLELRLEAQTAAVQATEAQREVLQAQRSQATADLTAARQSLELLIDEHEQVELAQAKVREAEAWVELSKTARQEAQLRLDRMLVRAPADGIVMVRLASPGSKLTLEGPEHSAHVVHIYDPSRLQVRVDVPLADAASVGLEQPAEIVVEVLPDRVFRGRVSRVVHEADIAKNTVEVKVAIDDPIPQLKPEMLARVRFLAIEEAATGEAALRQRIFAPNELLRTAGDGSTNALVIGQIEDGRGLVELRQLVLGTARLDGWREVATGLRPGDLLVADPSATLESGDRVRVLGESSTQAGAG